MRLNDSISLVHLIPSKSISFVFRYFFSSLHFSSSLTECLPFYIAWFTLLCFSICYVCTYIIHNSLLWTAKSEKVNKKATNLCMWEREKQKRTHTHTHGKSDASGKVCEHEREWKRFAQHSHPHTHIVCVCVCIDCANCITSLFRFWRLKFYVPGYSMEDILHC